MLNLNKSKICRVCLADDPCLQSLYREQTCYADRISFADIISQCTNFAVCQEDEFPQLICNNCMERARSAYSFRKLYEASNQTLLRLLTSIKENLVEELKSTVPQSGLLKTKEFLIAQPTEQLIKVEHIDEEDLLKTTKPYNSNDHLAANSGPSSYATPYEYLQENELIIKEEPTLQIETETKTSNLGYQMLNEEHSGWSPGDTRTSLCSTNGDQNLLNGKRKAEKKPHLSDGKKPCNCYHPDKVLAFPATAEIQESSTTEEKPFECQDCNETFRKTGTLKSHQRKRQTGVPLSKNALRCKMYREKKKSETQSENLQQAKNIQRCKAYRKRMKEIRNEKITAQALADDERRKKRKTNAQYCKDYRYRQYLKKNYSKNQESDVGEDLRSNQASFQHDRQAISVDAKETLSN